MKLIIKLFPEINIKTKSVRLYFIKILTNNINKILKRDFGYVKLIRFWDKIEVFINDITKQNVICDILIKIPGIQYILIVEEHGFFDINDINNVIYLSYVKLLSNKSFAIRVKRCGIHGFTSMDIERNIGNFLIKKIPSSFVNLNNPDFLIKIEINKNTFFLIKSQIVGMGGFPLGTQGDVLSLISGGFDSSVSSYMLIRRGCCVHYCFFNLGGGVLHEFNVKQIAFELWNRFGSSHEVRFISIDFSEIITELFKKINSYYINIILKRIMIRVAEKVANRFGIQAIVTGDSIGQVSSQTLSNLHVINDVTSTLILRPLISFDKDNIINIARKIGTAHLSASIPEYCGLVIKNTAIRANLETINNQEINFNFDILDDIVNKAYIHNIKNLIVNTNNNKLQDYLKIVSQYNNDDIIIDIRSPEEQEKSPININDIEIKLIPFYKLQNEFFNLSKNKTYLLYCKHGLMSKLQASYLIAKGFKNIKIYIPTIK